MKNKIIKIHLLALIGSLLLPLAWGGVEERALDAKKTVTLQLPNNPVTDVLNVYELLTKKKLVKPADLDTDKVISIFISEPISVAEAIQLLESALFLNGYALVPQDGNVTVVKLKDGGNPKQQGLPIYSSPEGLPRGSTVVSYYMRFENLSSESAAAIFNKQVSLSEPYGSIVTLPGSKALLITENTDVIRHMLKVKNLIDVPGKKLTTQFIQLNNADATRVAEVIRGMLSVKEKPDEKEGKGSNAGILKIGSHWNEKASYNLAVESIELIPDSRTNRIAVVTHPNNIAFIEKLIAQFDEAPISNRPVVRNLKYLTASDVLPVLAHGLGESSIGTEAIVTNFSSSVDSAHESSRRIVLEASTVTVGKTRIIGDNRSNSLLILGPSESVLTIDQILEVIDTVPRQVYLAVVIGQMDISDGQEYGLDILAKFHGNKGFGAGATSQVINGTDFSYTNPMGQVLETVAGFPAAATGFNLFGIAGHSIDFFVRALENTNRFHTISRPALYTSNNKKATILTGSEEPVPSTTLSSVVGGDAAGAVSGVTTTIDYKSILLKMSVTPTINYSNDVTLQINESNDSIGGDRTIGGNKVPIVNKQELDTSITVKNRETVILGGLITESNQNDDYGVPILSHIPLLGNLFKSKNKKTIRKELIIMIQPTIINSHPEATDLRIVEQARGLLHGHMNESIHYTDPHKPMHDFGSRYRADAQDLGNEDFALGE